MKKFDGILLCTDLDGTLLRNDKSISEENLRAIAHFKAEGGLFTFVTGRMPYYVTELYELVRPNAPIGCINGGGLYDYGTEKYLWAEELPREALTLVEAVERELPMIGIMVNTLFHVFLTRGNDAADAFYRKSKAERIPLHYRDVEEPIGKILLSDSEEENILRLAAFLRAHPLADRFSFVRSEHTLYEILPRGIDKGTVLPHLCRHVGVPLSRTVAVGDYENDTAMIRMAGLGVAVDNALPSVKAAADHVTVSNEEHAIARIVEDLECGRLSL